MEAYYVWYLKLWSWLMDNTYAYVRSVPPLCYQFSGEYYLVGIVLSLRNFPAFQKKPTAYIYKVVPGI
jgi:hypothetical protein